MELKKCSVLASIACWCDAYATSDDLPNNAGLARLTLGEGWYNNHYHFQGTARQGFHWWKMDVTYIGLKLLEALGVIWGVRPVPARIPNAPRIGGP